MSVPGVAITFLERTILSLLRWNYRALNQDRTAIHHNGLPGAVSFLHQKQIGLCNVTSFADSPHRQTLARAFKELLPLRWAHVLPQVRADDSRGYLRR